MFLPAILNQRDEEQNKNLICELLDTNNDSENRGLMLTLEDAREIVISRDNSLQNLGRVEIGLDTSKKLIQRLYDSPFICQEEYTDTLIALQEIFYYLKNETEDKINDEELMNIIFFFYNNVCEGSLLFLREALDEYAQGQRRENQKIDYLLSGVENKWS